MTRFLRLFSLVATIGSLVVAIGCGGSVKDDGSSDAAPKLDSAFVTDSFVAPDASVDVPADASCLDSATPLTSLFKGSSCTATVRLSAASASSIEIVGWSVACGAPSPATEAEARAAFAPHVAPYTTIDGYITAGAASVPTTDEYVFYKSPGDFGGMGVVSWARGDVLLAVELAWMGPMKVDIPTIWRPADEILARCTPSTFERLRVVSADGATLDDALVAAARTQVETSLLPAIVLHSGQAIANVLVTDLPATDASGADTRDLLFFVNSALLD